MDAPFYYTQKLISDLTLEPSIDLDLNIQAEGFEWSECIENGAMGNAEGKPISIKQLITTLTVLKEAGVTHVELGWHSDHQQYEISGYYIRKSLPIEVEKLTERERIIRERQLKIFKLRNQIKQLESEALPQI